MSKSSSWMIQLVWWKTKDSAMKNLKNIENAIEEEQEQNEV